ncbi:hypothetical protein MY04_3810 [Flammeovirga sp. MY04]|uniref:leucine-rich repeat domain-containing protein n=1 Tax=Flammeovirga sp. MY04 TaxID=1191459 RepID=UPI0008062E16|nr:leucine-rich repeat domain-containing protein [Flammeovirga sp. MY04]ANQ51154.1 hypothetical protein MY04_3810 [Flammeovirga sp. MY04]
MKHLLILIFSFCTLFSCREMPSNQTPTEEIALSEAFKKKYTYFAVSIDSNGYVKSIAYRESNHPSLRSLGELITEVPEEFLRFKRLKKLKLYQNQLTSLPDFIQEFDSLEVLDFHDNPIDELPEWVGRLKHLKYLDLSKTNIKTLPKSLTSLKHLEAIRFRHTPIQGFPEELFSFKSTLQELYVDELEELPEEISDFKKLKLIGGEIHSFKHLDKIPQLEVIYINDSKAKNFPADFGPIHHLSNLHLYDCKYLTKLPLTLGKGKHLGSRYDPFPSITLKFSGCEKLQGLPMSFQGKKLTTFNISGCKSFNYMPSDMYIGNFEAHGNFWHNMPKNFYKNDVRDFEMYDHNIISLRGIGNFKNLRFLKLASGKIHRLPDEICNCKKLMVIDVSGNPIKYIPDCLEDLEELEKVYVEKTPYWDELQK